MSLNIKHRVCIFFVALASGGALSAAAQDVGTRPAAPTESVTVTGIKDTEAAIDKFVGATTVATQVAGKLARWNTGVCPIALGVRPDIAKLLTKRVRDVAAEIGAPVNGKESCPTNIEIIFTAAPQALLDNIQIMHPVLLGYHENSAQAASLATISRPIQSWYMTATVDLRGRPQLDGKRAEGVTMSIQLPPAGFGGPATGAADTVELNMPGAIATNGTGGRLGDGISSVLYNVVIVADTSKLLGRDTGTLADYIAMLALSQVQQPDNCQDLPSILNLLLPDCSRTSNALTSGDVAYLRALYKTTPTANFRGQRNEMKYQMNKSLGVNQ